MDTRKKNITKITIDYLIYGLVRGKEGNWQKVRKVVITLFNIIIIGYGFLETTKVSIKTYNSYYITHPRANTSF